MRIAAGILMILYGVKTIGIYVSSIFLYEWDFRGDYFDLALFLISIIAAVFFITGGVFCLKMKYWKLCFASALVTLLIMIMWLTGYVTDSIWSAWVVSMVGTFPIIFVCLTKKEWQEISA